MPRDLTSGPIPLREILQDSAAFPADKIPEFVDRILAAAAASGGSDLHFEPRAEHLYFKLRLNGALCEAGRMISPLRANVIQRIKVLAGLMTYRTIFRRKAGLKCPPAICASLFIPLFSESAQSFGFQRRTSL